MVQQINQRIAILISGKMGSGKTTLAEWLQKKYGFKIYKFAHVIYDFINRLGIPKNRVLMQKFGDTIRAYDENFFARTTINLIVQDNYPLVVIDDWRYINEYEEAQKLIYAGYNLVTVNLQCDFEVIKNRLIEKYGEFSEEYLQHETEKNLDSFDKYDYVFDTTHHTAESIEQVADAIIQDLTTIQKISDEPQYVVFEAVKAYCRWCKKQTKHAVIKSRTVQEGTYMDTICVICGLNKTFIRPAQ